jgi:hypothetical protein
MSHIPYLLGPAIGLLYGAFVEVDDGGAKSKPAAKVPERKPEKPA